MQPSHRSGLKVKCGKGGSAATGPFARTQCGSFPGGPEGTIHLLLATIAGRGFTRDYAKRVLSRLEPRVIIPSHFDDFFRPLSAEMGFSLNVNFGGFLEEVRAVSSDFQVMALRPLQTVSGV